MKIRLPNGEKQTLDEGLTLDEKLKLVKELTEEWMPTIKASWQNDTIRFFLDSLSNYLVWHKEANAEVNSHDKDVMSRNKTNRLVRGRKDIPFSSLSIKDRETLLGEVRGIDND